MVEYKFKILEKRKKKGGKYYVLLVTDGKYFSQILGRYSSKSKLVDAMKKYGKRYGIYDF